MTSCHRQPVFWLYLYWFDSKRFLSPMRNLFQLLEHDLCFFPVKLRFLSFRMNTLRVASQLRPLLKIGNRLLWVDYWLLHRRTVLNFHLHHICYNALSFHCHHLTLFVYFSWRKMHLELAWLVTYWNDIGLFSPYASTWSRFHYQRITEQAFFVVQT
jgi:hypothetical protein